jgi:hypothetical protein
MSLELTLMLSRFLITTWQAEDEKLKLKSWSEFDWLQASKGTKSTFEGVRVGT